ncbi:MAG TPA: LytR family transcriptional regulator [bacterium (Candidatus Stahlbacteria)]|nr:LytR family transcriptional regulator [Candidatus Stahlbacteria bacterium]
MGRINILFLILGSVIIVLGISLYNKFEKKSIKNDLYENSKLRVEVLNGCGVDNLAMIISDKIRKLGFDVVETGDASNFEFKETVIIDRTDKNLKNAKRIGSVIGCRKFGRDIDSTLYIDVTVLLGKDYERYFPDVKKNPPWKR